MKAFDDRGSFAESGKGCEGRKEVRAVGGVESKALAPPAFDADSCFSAHQLGSTEQQCACDRLIGLGGVVAQSVYFQKGFAAEGGQDQQEGSGTPISGNGFVNFPPLNGTAHFFREKLD